VPGFSGIGLSPLRPLRVRSGRAPPAESDIRDLGESVGKRVALSKSMAADRGNPAKRARDKARGGGSSKGGGADGPGGQGPRGPGGGDKAAAAPAEKSQPQKKTSPFEFIQQVRQEVSKVTWPTRNETFVTSVMVLIMVTLAAIFFFLVDQVISLVIRLILGLGG
jgi:preprotein translocase subunit SecE